MTSTGERPTLATIAEAAGVSLPTVSKVLNGRRDVAPATRERVERLLAEYRYEPASTRRPPRMPERPVVDLVFSALDSPWAVEIIRGVTGDDLDVVVSSMQGTGADAWVSRVCRPGRDGCIVVTSHLPDAHRRRLERAGRPVVVIDPADMPDPDLPSVGATNWAGGLAATDHLIGLGHRRVAVVSGREDLLCSRARVDGFRAALERAGVAVDPDAVRYANFHHDGAFRAVGPLLDLPADRRPTAVFAGSDEQAFGVIEAARLRGLSVPDDLSVVGFDDLPMSRWASPPLTTVRQPLEEMGRHAARMVADMIAGRPLGSLRVELATRLVVRSSTAPPRG
jgi:LacI family transcriptional regulator